MGTIVPSSATPGRVRRLGACLILSAAVLAPVAWGQSDPPKTTLPTSIELPRLLDLAAERLHVRVEYVPSVLSGIATLRGDVSDEELWGVVNSRLADAGFTTIRGAVPSQFKVVKLESGLGGSAPLEPVRWVTQSLPDAQPPRTGQQIDWPPGPRPGYASTVVQLRNRTAKEIAESIRPLLTKSGSVTVVPGSADRVILSDLTPKLEEVLGLLPLVDAPSDASVIEEIPLKGASASALVASVKELAAKRELIVGESTPGGPRSAGEILASPGGRSVLLIAPKQTLGFWRDLVGRLDTQASIEIREYTPRVFAIKDVASLVTDLLKGKAEDQLRIVPDELTGTLIVTATPEQHERIAALMSRLDATPSEATSRLRSFAIRNRPVKDVAEALNTLLGAGDIEFNGASPSRGRLMPGVPGNAAVPGASDTPDASSATTPRSRRVSQDSGRTSQDARTASPRPQITMTVDEGMNTLIVVGEPRVLAQIEELLKTLDVRQPQVMIEVTLVSLTDGQSLALGVELQKFGSLGGNAIQLSSLFGSAATGTPPNIAGTPGTGFTGAVLNPGDFNAVLKALERVNAGRSSSTPRVLVANNQEANFKSVAQQPTSNTSTNTTSTTITSFGGFQDAGTSIRVKPQIAEGDRLTLDYSIELSSFTGQPTGGLPSARQQNSVASVSQIPDGFTVIVGGFELKTESQDESRVPLVGQIPLVGELFKSRTKTNDRTRFFAFIRANIMRGGGFEELKYISAKDAKASAVADDWPEVEPLVIK